MLRYPAAVLRWCWSIRFIVLFALALVGLVVGLGWWIHPGAGIALASLLLAAACLFGEAGGDS